RVVGLGAGDHRGPPAAHDLQRADMHDGGPDALGHTHERRLERVRGGDRGRRRSLARVAQPSEPGIEGETRARTGEKNRTGTPGAFAPLAPGRGDLYLGQQARSIAGPDYRLGPGDVLDVQIVGRLDVTRVQIVVDPEGAIALPPLGTIRVARLTLLEANRTITAPAR